MNNKNFCLFIRIIASVLSAVICLCGMVGCGKEKADVKDPVLECENGAIPLSFYEFLLSRMRGTLARNQYDVKDPDFWSTPVEGTEHTYESYYNSAVLDSCKNYLAASVLFDKTGLSLPDSVYASVKEEVEFYIDYDGRGNEEDFNKLVEKYGVDADSLTEAYILEKKYEYLLSYLYGNGSLIADTVKEEYYRENYYRFKQILFPNFYYDYERDSEGNIIYFDTEKGVPLYDTSGVYLYDGDGNRIKDEYGSTIYYDLDGNILYDTENGQPSVVTDESGEGVKHYYSLSEFAEIRDDARALAERLSDKNYSAFEAEMAKRVNIEGADDAYPDGYYLSRVESSSYEDHMTDILALLEEMEIGEIRLLESKYGCHIIMKYELDPGKYSDGKYAEWFAKFTDSLINKLFLDKCKEILPEIKVNEENLAKARSIRRIGTNYDY